MKYAFITLLLCLGLVANAQNTPIGQWQTHFSYGNSKSVAYDGKEYVYSADQNLFRYSTTEKSFDIFSKVNGLSDIDIRLIRYNRIDDYLVIIYESGNIDLLVDNNFINLPDIRNLNTSGSKNINDIYFFNELIYLSTDFGIVVLNPNKKEIKETYVLQDANTVAKVNSFTNYNGQFIASSDLGCFVVDENQSVLQDFTKWTLLPNLKFVKIASDFDNYLFAATDTLLLLNTSSFISNWDTIGQSAEATNHIVLGAQQVYFVENGATSKKIYTFDFQGTPNDVYFIGLNALDVTESGNTFYIADGFTGLTHITGNINKETFQPDGVKSNSIFNISVDNNEILVSGGRRNSAWQTQSKRDGLSRYDYSSWRYYNQFDNIPAMDTVLDILDATIDPRNQHIMMASFGGGLLELAPDLTPTVYKYNSILQPYGGSNVFRLADLQFDTDNNLWMSNYGVQSSLVVKKADGGWQSFVMPYPAGTPERSASQILIDDNNQKWMVAPRNVGLFVFDDNGTIDVKTDDKVKILRQGNGNGNLPNNNINCLAKDKDGAIWVGTNDGIAIFNCPGSVLTDGCDAELRIVQYDANAGLLFQNENVSTIAVDGANNKWIGTANGVWQISDDAETILKQFNEENSPLPTDEINRIAIHPTTGDVFIATTGGLVSYRSEATEGNLTSENLLVFPNPVPSGYNGTIAIKGVTENADVRITDVSGQLIYRVKAQGGQAVWNGQTYTGQRPMSGVYFVFVTDKDGEETGSTKFIFQE
jgi:hypothetical protein